MPTAAPPAPPAPCARSSPDRRTRPARRRAAAVAVVVAAGLVLAACGGGPSTTARAATAAKGSGPLDVLYAGSLVDLMEQVVAPGFDAATGYRFRGFSGNSGALANEIRGKTQVGDVFISAAPSKNALLEGAANGNWVSWYAMFATSPLVIGYNPHSRFAAALRSRPWYDVVAQPGFLLGRSDPATDPKGKLAVEALDRAASAHHLPALAAAATSSSDVYAENTMVGRLQAGQLDGGFFYSVEAAAAGFPTVAVASSSPLEARFTVTILRGAPHPAAARAFVRWLVGPAGAAALRREALSVLSPPVLSGTVPSSLRGAFGGS